MYLITRVPIIGLRVPIITRVPILGLREPIIGLRKSIFFGEQLNWDVVYKKLNNYVKFAAKQVSSRIDSQITQVISAEDLYQEGLLLLYKCYSQYIYKPECEFYPIFKASLWRSLRNLAYKQELFTTDIDEAADVGFSDTALDDIFEEYKIKTVVELLKERPVAQSILKEMISPSNKTIWESNMDMARKETLRDQGHKLNVPKSIDVKGIFIQRALNLSKDIYMENLKLIQNAVYQVYSKDTNISKYIPSLTGTNQITTESHNNLEVMA